MPTTENDEIRLPDQLLCLRSVPAVHTDKALELKSRILKAISGIVGNIIVKLKVVGTVAEVKRTAWSGKNTAQFVDQTVVGDHFRFVVAPRSVCESIACKKKYHGLPPFLSFDKDNYTIFLPT